MIKRIVSHSAGNGIMNNKKNGIIITMDQERRILEDGAIAILDDRIVEIEVVDTPCGP